MVSGHRAGETVAEVELGGMAASLAVSGERLEGHGRFMGPDRYQGDPRFGQDFGDIRFGFFGAGVVLAAQGERRFEDGYGGGDRADGAFEAIDQGLSFWFTGQDGDDGRGVNEHLYRSPLSSS